MNDTPAHPRTRIVGRLLAVTGVTGFAISEPILSMLGSQPEFFITSGTRGWVLIEFAFIVALILPLSLWLVGELICLLSKRLGFVVHLCLVTGLAVVALASLLRSTGVESSVVLLGASSAGGLACGTLYWRSRAFATGLQYTAALPLAALVLFLGFSKSGELIFKTDHEPTFSSAKEQAIPSVVFVMFDELPTQSLLNEQGMIDRDRFPNFAALSDVATWYPEYSTVAPQTYMAVPSILTGSNPGVLLDPTLRDYPDNLFTLLEPTHNLHVFETITRLCGMLACGEAESKSIPALLVDALNLYRLRFQRTVGFVAFLETKPVSAARVDPEGQSTNQELVDALERLPGNVTKRLAQFVQELDDSTASTLHYLHLSVPHSPWSMYPDGSKYLWPPPFTRFYTEAVTFENEYLSALNEQRHLLQAQWGDRMLGVILAKLKGSGQFEDSLVVVVADHGISFEESSFGRWYTPKTVAGVAYAPFLVKSPGQSIGIIDSSNVLSIDVLPTIADELGLQVPFDIDGVSAISPEIEDRDDEKYLYDLQQDGFAVTFEGIVTFDATQTRPDASKRLTGPAYDPKNPISGLLKATGVEEFIGRPLDELKSGISGSAFALWADDFANPNPALPPPGGVIGYLRNDMTGDLLLVAIDGTVVTGSPLYTIHEQPNSFAALLPPGALDSEGNNLRLAVVSDGVVTEIRRIR